MGLFLHPYLPRSAQQLPYQSCVNLYYPHQTSYNLTSPEIKFHLSPKNNVEQAIKFSLPVPVWREHTQTPAEPFNGGQLFLHHFLEHMGGPSVLKTPIE